MSGHAHTTVIRNVKNEMKYRGTIRGRSEGSSNHPKILEEKKLEIEHPEAPMSKARQSDPPM